MRKRRNAFFNETSFPSPLVNVIPDEDGISYGMMFGAQLLGTPSVAYLERQSTRQPILKHRLQQSLYISKFRIGLQSLLNYPIARGATVVNSAPPNIGAPPSNRSGTMQPPSRFTKALPAPLVPFNPPVYR